MICRPLTAQNTICQRALENKAISARCDIESLVNILAYYKTLNHKLLIVIENPTGYLRHHPVSHLFETVLCLEMVTISYCKFSTSDKSFPQKDTDLWTNSKTLLSKFKGGMFQCTPSTPCLAKEKSKHAVLVQDLKDRCSKYPSTVCSFIAPLLRADAIESHFLG